MRWLFLLAVAAAALIGFDRLGERSVQSDHAPARATRPLAGVAQDYTKALAEVDEALGAAKARAEARPDEWLMHDVVARRWLARARLTGSYEDYAGAREALRRGFSVAAVRTGPHHSAAVLAFSMHQLAEAERNLDEIARYAVPPDRAEQAEFTAMRGDIALYRGQYEAAVTAYDAADRIAPGAADFRRAIYHSMTGRPDLADDFFNKTENGLSNSTRQARGTLELQRGILDLDRGRLDDALVHFRRADRIFPGFWLIEEHIAEVTALKGDSAAAERLYRDIVRRTGHAEFMDALAQIAAGRGDRRAAAHWFARAGAGWAERLRTFPEASYGHAIDHCIAKRDWACALSLAHRNHQARPYGGAKIALARALLASGRAGEARAIIESVLASPWRSAELHAVAAEIYTTLGLGSKAAEQNRAQEALKGI